MKYFNLIWGCEYNSFYSCLLFMAATIDQLKATRDTSVKQCLEFCRLMRTYFFHGQYLKPGNGWFLLIPLDEHIACECWEKKTSKDGFLFRHAVYHQYTLRLPQINLSFEWNAARHATILNLHWVNNYMRACISRQWNDDVLDDLFSSFCKSYTFIQKLLTVLREMLY